MGRVPAWGWNERCQLCGQAMPLSARSGRPEGNAVAVVREDDGRVAEGMVVSADGEKFIASVHSPNNRSGQPLGLGDFRVVSTSGEGAAVPVSADSSTNATVFLKWWWEARGCGCTGGGCTGEGGGSSPVRGKRAEVAREPRCVPGPSTRLPPPTYPRRGERPNRRP